MIDYVYSWIRKDLPLHQQIIQSAHSALEAGREFPNTGGTSHLVLLQAESELELIEISERLTALSIKYHMFHEPDDRTGFTSITTEPILSNQRKGFKQYKLYSTKETQND